MTEKTVILPVGGMSCANCAANIERTLNKKVDGVLDAAVNFASEQVTVSFDPGKVSVSDLVANISKAGYSVPAGHVDMPVTGMSCVNCAANIERALNNIKSFPLHHLSTKHHQI